MNISEYLKITIEKDASDLHLSSGMFPMIRVDGSMTKINDTEILDSNTLTQELFYLMTEKHIEQFQKNLNVDFSYTFDNNHRFRVNVYQQRLGVAAAFRFISNKVPTLEQINAPAIINKLLLSKKGLILVTGPTGSGKSTTLAAMIAELNQTQLKHIITIEDPVEYYHQSYNCLINQREIGRDVKDFSSALEATLREDPDVILVGELRDLDTIRLALTAAETGHLVFATLHTNSAAKTIDRIIDVFPGEEKAMVRTMLSESLCAIVAQTLIPKANGGGRVAAFEVLVATPAVRNLVRENKIAQLYTTMQTSTQYGMQTLEHHLQSLVAMGVIKSDQLHHCLH